MKPAGFGFGQGLRTKQWRRERDSNPRYTFWAYTRFPVVLLQPLGHLSANGFPTQDNSLYPQRGQFLAEKSKNHQFLFQSNGQRPKSGGEGGIRTHVPCSSQDNSISSRARYGHFGTSPQQKASLTPMQGKPLNFHSNVSREQFKR